MLSEVAFLVVLNFSVWFVFFSMFQECQLPSIFIRVDMQKIRSTHLANTHISASMDMAMKTGVWILKS